MSFGTVVVWFVRQIVLILPQTRKIPSGEERERGYPSGLTQRSVMNPILYSRRRPGAAATVPRAPIDATV